MTDSKKMLADIQQSVQKKKLELRSAMSNTMRTGLRSTLRAQLKEYEAIDREINAIANRRGWELSGMEPTRQYVSKFRSKISMAFTMSDSKIAEKVITGSTKTMIHCLRNAHGYKQIDAVSDLSQRFLDCERETIQHLQGFL